VTDAQLLEADQQLPEPVQPREGTFNDPAPGPAPRMVPTRGGVASLGDMGPIPALDHRAPSRLPGVALIRTQVVPNRWAPHDQAVQRGHQEPHVMPVRPADDYRQRDSMAVHEEAAFRALFFPDPSGWPRRPLGPGALFRGPHRHSATPRRSLRARRIPPGPVATAGRRPRRASRRGSIYGWNWHSRTAPWGALSTGSRSARHTRCPRKRAGGPAVSAHPRVCGDTAAPSGVSGAGSAERLWPTRHRTRSRIGVRSCWNATMRAIFPQYLITDKFVG